MGIPFWAAIRAVPWGVILEGAPALARAAESLLRGSRGRRAAVAAGVTIEGVSARVTMLEEQNQADAALLKQVSDQVAALSLAIEVVAARQRWLWILTTTAVAVAAVAVVVAVR